MDGRLIGLAGDLAIRTNSLLSFDTADWNSTSDAANPVAEVVKKLSRRETLAGFEKFRRLEMELKCSAL